MKSEETNALFVWLINHQPPVLFSQNKSTTSNQAAVLFSQNKSAPAINHQPNGQAARPLPRPSFRNTLPNNHLQSTHAILRPWPYWEFGMSPYCRVHCVMAHPCSLVSKSHILQVELSLPAELNSHWKLLLCETWKLLLCEIEQLRWQNADAFTGINGEHKELSTTICQLHTQMYMLFHDLTFLLAVTIWSFIWMPL
jgi:hypothetical protein